MPRPAFGRLSKIWSDADEPADLIRRYTERTIRMSRKMERVYIGEDCESEYMRGLYEAAFSWTPDRGPFSSWLWLQLRTSHKTLKYRFMRWGASMRRYPPETIDDRLSYSDN